jgi:hypothetical protein
MCRRLAAAIMALGLTAAASAALADDAMERRLQAHAQDYNSRSWVRVEGSGGRFAWVETRDARRLVGPTRPRKLLVLWSDSLPFVRHVGEGVRYMVSEETFDCRRRAITSHNWFFGPVTRVMAERVPETEDASESDFLFAVVCKREPMTRGRRLQGAAAVIASEPDLGAEPPR